MKSLDRIRGAMYGVAVGDALGAPLEFMDAESIKQKHGTVREMVGGGWLNVRPGEVTDDTQMTLCVARGIAANMSSPVEPVGMQFIRWYESRPRDVGSICASSISKAMLYAHGCCPTENVWWNAALDSHIAHDGKSAGNGSLMRTVYVGLYYKSTTNVFNLAQRISEMTHYDPIASSACSSYSLAVSRLIKEDDLERRRGLLKYAIPTVFEPTLDYNVLSRYDFQPNPTGYVVDSYAAALHCLYTTGTFEEAIVKAVNLGGDADTIGAITGGLAGALYGFESIPERWINCLDLPVTRELDLLSEIAAKNA